MQNRTNNAYLIALSRGGNEVKFLGSHMRAEHTIINLLTLASVLILCWVSYGQESCIHSIQTTETLERTSWGPCLRMVSEVVTETS